MPVTAYTQAGNCARAARAKLGKTAVKDIHFTVSKSESGFYRWAPIEGAPHVPAMEPAAAPIKDAKAKRATRTKAATATKARSKGASLLSETGSGQKALKLIRRAKGVSVEEGAAETGWEPHTFRAMVSRLMKECHISKTKVDSKTRYGDGRLRGAKVAAAA